MDNEFPRRFLKMSEVEKIVGFSKSTINRYIRKGCFPVPYKLDPIGRTLAWASDEIQEWIESRTKHVVIED